MGKRKAAQNSEIKPWFSAKPDNKEGRFIQVGNSLMLSKKFQGLRYSTQRLYECMGMESAGNRDFKFPQKTAKKYGFTNKTLIAGVKELQEKGFIKVISGRNTRQPNLYSFCFDWKL